MNKEIILSVVIPTYNRVKFLETTINCFIKQITGGALDGEVEIVVGNDASPDGTGKYIEQLEKNCEFVKAINNISNLGLSGNVEKLVDKARGEYIWLCGEDDLIIDKSVERVMRAIKTNNPNYILINTSNIISSDDRNLNYKIDDENRLDLREDIFIGNFEQEKGELSKAKDWLYLTNLLSAVAFKKKLFLAEMAEAKKYLRPVNAYLFQAPLIIGIAKWGRLNIIADCLVLHRKNETHWSKSVQGNFTVSLYDSSEILNIIKHYIPGEYKDYQKRFAAYTFWAVRDAKQKGINVNKYIFDAIRKNYNCYPYNIRFLTALFAPGIIVKMHAKLWRGKKI